MGLRVRILAVCLLLACLSTLVVVAGVVMPKLADYPRVDAQLAHMDERAAKLAAVTVGSVLEDQRDLLARLAAHEEFKDGDWTAAGVSLGRGSATQEEHPPMVALDAGLRVVASDRPVRQPDFGALAIARAALDSPHVLRSGLVAWPDGGTPTVASARRFRYFDHGQARWGVLVSGLDLAALDALLNERTGHVMVFDAAGHQLVPAPPAGAMLDGQGRPGLTDALAGRAGVVTRQAHDVSAYAPVPEVGWAVLANTPGTQMLLPLENDVRQALYAGLCAMAIGVVLAIVTSAYLVAPIRRLEQGATALARGEWEAGGAGKALLSTHRSDELGRLAQSFEAMASQLRDRFRGIEDVVEQRTVDLAEANQRLREAVADLEALDELKRAFLDAVSHELRTPLNFIMGYGSTLADGLMGPLSGEQERAVEAILGGADRLLAVVNNLIQISRLEAGDWSLLPHALDLSESVMVVCHQLEPQRRERDVSFDVQVSQDLPAAFADPECVGQILRQLISNAIKFTEPGGRITIAATALDQQLVVTVRDTGVGIADGQLPTIWEAFRQGDGSLTRRHGGTGVGLAIVKRLVEAMGERVEVESQLDRGSCFRFTLPRATADGRAPVPVGAP